MIYDVGGAVHDEPTALKLVAFAREPVSGPLGQTEVVKNKQADRRG